MAIWYTLSINPVCKSQSIKLSLNDPALDPFTPNKSSWVSSCVCSSHHRCCCSFACKSHSQAFQCRGTCSVVQEQLCKHPYPCNLGYPLAYALLIIAAVVHLLANRTVRLFNVEVLVQWCKNNCANTLTLVILAGYLDWLFVEDRDGAGGAHPPCIGGLTHSVTFWTYMGLWRSEFLGRAFASL